MKLCHLITTCCARRVTQLLYCKHLCLFLSIKSFMHFTRVLGFSFLPSADVHFFCMWLIDPYINSWSLPFHPTLSSSHPLQISCCMYTVHIWGSVPDAVSGHWYCLSMGTGRQVVNSFGWFLLPQGYLQQTISYTNWWHCLNNVMNCQEYYRRLIILLISLLALLNITVSCTRV
jgi:hypothetical protein